MILVDMRDGILEPERKKKKKITAMWDEFGMLKAHYCSDCCHLVKITHRGRNYYKCKIYGRSNSVATDWAKSWTACRMWNVLGIRKENIYRDLRRPTKALKDDEPLEGQISMWE